MPLIDPDKDPLGRAVLDYLETGRPRDIEVLSDLAEDDVLPVAWLFRDAASLPPLERLALEACRGLVLDVGAGAGCHSLLLQARGFAVEALDASALCCQAMRRRGVARVRHGDIRGQEGCFDTILFLMNGLGIGGDPSGVEGLLRHCAGLLAPGGQILFDSTDPAYLYEEDEDALSPRSGTDKAAGGDGQFRFTMRYAAVRSESFPWIYLDTAACRSIADRAGLRLEILATEEDGPAWLGRLTPAD
jgi:SAM-dependent methyltransferase